ncbi:hypothetical protein C5B99_12050 [Pseudoclavibacter sp. Z016]|nr:hypothetical protein C5B99_12050 [Pseudoclavibacter sp. Z016]
MDEDMTPSPENSEPPLSALMKGLTLMEAVSEHHRISDLATATGLSVSTVHRVLSDLVEHDWIEHGADRTYRPGARTHLFAASVQRDERATQKALPLLQRLRDEVGCTVHMARFRQTTLMYVAKIDGPAAYQMRSRVGDTIPLWSTAIGKSILAALSPELSSELLMSAELTRRTVHSIVSKRELQAQLRVVSERGWAIDDQENELGIRCVGAALRSADGSVIGGVSTSGLEHEMTPEKIQDIVPHLLRTVTEIRKLV